MSHKGIVFGNILREIICNPQSLIVLMYRCDTRSSTQNNNNHHMSHMLITCFCVVQSYMYTKYNIVVEQLEVVKSQQEER